MDRADRNIKTTRREKEREQKRQEMLDAALTLFSEKGYHNVTMHEIAEKAEFAIGTLYKYFRNKEDLYTALILQKSGQFQVALFSAIEGSEDETEKLRRYIKIKGELFKTNFPVVRLYFNEFFGESFDYMTGLNIEIQKQHDELLKRLEIVFTNGIKKKRFKRIADPYHLAVAFDGISTTCFFKWLKEPELHPYLEDPDNILKILFKSLVDHYATPCP